MSSLQFAKLNLDMIALDVQSLESESERKEVLDMLAQLAQDLEKTNQVETVAQDNYKNELLRATNLLSPARAAGLERMRAPYEEKFKCSQCGKCFLNNSKLKRHTSSSGGCAARRFGPEESKTFRCPECDHRSSTRDGLTTHQIKHSDRFKCIKCERRFSRLRELEKHQRNSNNCLKFMNLHSSSS